MKKVILCGYNLVGCEVLEILYPFATYKVIEIKSISEFKNIVNEE